MLKEPYIYPVLNPFCYFKNPSSCCIKNFIASGLFSSPSLLEYHHIRHSCQNSLSGCMNMVILLRLLLKMIHWYLYKGEQTPVQQMLKAFWVSRLIWQPSYKGVFNFAIVILPVALLCYTKHQTDPLASERVYLHCRLHCRRCLIANDRSCQGFLLGVVWSLL